MEPRCERTRMKRPALEAAFDKACGDALDYCQVCRGPLSDKGSTRAVNLYDDEHLGTCSACGREVDPDGLTMLISGSTGTYRRAVFRLRGRRSDARGGDRRWPS